MSWKSGALIGVLEARGGFGYCLEYDVCCCVDCDVDLVCE